MLVVATQILIKHDFKWIIVMYEPCQFLTTDLTCKWYIPQEGNYHVAANVIAAFDSKADAMEYLAQAEPAIYNEHFLELLDDNK